jgi:hypothetical protein
MSFKITNSLIQEANRESVLYHAKIENVSAAATLNPSIPVTKVNLGTAYTLTLPNGEVGEQKVITGVSGSANVAVSFNDGWGNAQTRTLYNTGDLLIFYATSLGWHCNSDYTD